MMDFPFHVSLVMNNSAGYFFVNREVGVAVQRMIAIDQFSEAVSLLDTMADDLAYSQSDTVLLDLNLLPADFSEVYCMSLIRFCLASPQLATVAVVGHRQKLANAAGLAELRTYAASQGVRLILGDAVDAVVADMSARAPSSKLTPRLPTAFVGGYGGSVYVWPEQRAVVVALSGNAGDTVATQEVLAAGFAACAEHGAEVLVVDTTDFPALYDEGGCDLVGNSILKPAAISGIKRFVHVRTIGDKAMTGPSIVDVAGELDEAGVEYHRVGNLQQAMMLLAKLEGFPETHVAPSGNLH